MEYNLKEVDVMGDFTPAPAGFYNLLITDCKKETTKAENGEMMVFEFQIVDGKYKGKKLWDYINIANPSKVCVVEIGMSAIKTIRKFTGLNENTFDCENAQEYVGKVVGAKLVIDTYNGNDNNKVKIYSKSIPVDSASDVREETAIDEDEGEEVPFS